MDVLVGSRHARTLQFACLMLRMLSINASTGCTIVSTKVYQETIASPIPYPNYHTECWHLISADGQSSIEINIIMFQTESGYDFLYIYDGDDASSPLIDQWAGSMALETIVSTGPAIFLEFESDHSHTDEGFIIGHNIVPTGCTQLTAEASEASFTSGGYPSLYPVASAACWVISTALDDVVKLAVHDFHTENNSDIVRVRDGEDVSSDEIAYWTGEVGAERKVTSSGTALYVYFSSDASNAETGFNLRYVLGSACSPIYADENANTIVHGYPYTHHENECWLLEAADGTSPIQLEAISVDLENVYDTLTVYDGNSQVDFPLIEWTGSVTSEAVISGSYQLVLVFRTDHSIIAEGFTVQVGYADCTELEANWTAEPLRSPGYPGDYDNSLALCWSLSNSLGRRLIVNVMDFHTESDHDVVRVTEVVNNTLNELAYWDGYVSSGTEVWSSSSTLRVLFTTDHSDTEAGFELTYNVRPVENACGSTPCQHQGACANIASGFTCTCQGGYEGRTCQTETDECANGPCENGATCDDGIGGYTCACVDGWEGENCEIDIDDCANGPCGNGAVCNDLLNRYECVCPAGWEGPNCDIDFNECSSAPCQNGGACTDWFNGYTCACAPGFQGLPCDVDCKTSARGTDFIGPSNVTLGGLECDRWSQYSETNFPDGTAELAGNKCRNPTDLPTVWCHTTDPDKPWDYCQVPVCNDDEFNLAWNQPTWESSSYNVEGYPFTSWAAVDGNRGGVLGELTCTHTETEENPFWAVDLGKRYFVGRVTVTNRDHEVASRLENFTVIVSDQPPPLVLPLDESIFFVCHRYSGYPPTGTTATALCHPVPVWGRYVYIHLEGPGRILTICEVQVYGLEADRVYRHLSVDSCSGNTEFNSSPVKNFTDKDIATCGAVFESDENFIRHQFLFNKPHKYTFTILILGNELSCFPGDGVGVTVTSSSGQDVTCMSYTGGGTGNLVACRYRCVCPDDCIYSTTTYIKVYQSQESWDICEYMVLY